jgi:hypothetical protein
MAMKRFSHLLVLVGIVCSCLLGFGSPTTQAEQVSGVDRDIYELLDVTGSYALGQQVMRGVLQPIMQASPKIPKKFWDEMLGRFTKDDFYGMLVPIYRKHLQAGDIKALLTFYKTPSGQRVLKSLPLITQESIGAGQAWGQKVIRDITQEARKRGYEI